MTPPKPPATRVLYHLLVSYPKRAEVAVTLEAQDAVAWVNGFAAALGQQDRLDVIDQHAPEDTRRVQALQIGDALGWFSYLYPETVEG